MELPAQYNAKEVEDKIYQLWEKSGFFAPDKLPGKRKKPFTIIMPPSNANGNLHAGHALVMTIEDIMTRYKRMRGFKTLWLPGLDHAGFETQVVFEKQLEKEGRSRFKMTPEELYKGIWDFTETNKQNIKNQVKKMGASCDWSREKFTLDDDIVKIVTNTFEKLKKDNLIYRGRRIVNWCPKHRTSLSDLETKYEERVSPLYFIKYPIKDSTENIIVATTRPETMLGDTAVAVNPKDKRYKILVGKTVVLPIVNREIPIVADKDIDLNFGTGAVKVTPAHDPLDFEISQRHNLEIVQVIGFDGKLNDKTGLYQGIPAPKARQQIVEHLKAAGLIEKIDQNYKNRVNLCYKCNSLIEPQMKEQWFLKMKPLAKPAIDAIKKNKIKFIPGHYKKIVLHWLHNIIDWNISRQIVWGIPIPGDQSGDVFDTWFSSSQWPFATLRAGRNKNDFKTFYPTDVMETGGDLIFFWVSRMIMFSLYNTKKIPFKNVYMHGLVLDAKGQKMSKSKGNVINPLDLIEKFGTDALRMGLVVGNTPGTSLPLDENKIKGYRNFATKIWNAARFVLLQTGNSKPEIRNQKLTKNDKKLLKDFEKMAKSITKDMDDFKFYIASEKIYHYFWHTFCDKIIEDYKEKKVSQYVLLTILFESLKILHPFMPFITEEIYQQLPIKNKKECIMIEEWITQ